MLPCGVVEVGAPRWFVDYLLRENVMSRDATFWRMASTVRVHLHELGQGRPETPARAAQYIKRAAGLAKVLQVDNFPKSLVEWDGYRYGDGADRVAPALYDLESFMDRVYVENLFELDGQAQTLVALDATWKAKTSSYISRIRDIVSAAQMNDPLRQKIMQRLNALQGEIDRNQTRIEAFGEMLVTLTGAVGRGAKNLEPAIKLAQRVAGSLLNLREDRDEQPPLALPPPETLGLPDPDEPPADE